MWTSEQTVAVPVVQKTHHLENFSSHLNEKQTRQPSCRCGNRTTKAGEQMCLSGSRAPPALWMLWMWRRLRLSNWWIHLAGKIGAVITPQRQGCFVSGKNRKTPLCWSRWAFNDQPHSVANNSNTVSNTYILSLNSKKQGCCTWISKPPHQSAGKFANLRWTQKNFQNTAPRNVSHTGEYWWDVCWILEVRWTNMVLVNEQVFHLFFSLLCLFKFFTFKNIHRARIGNVKQIGKSDLRQRAGTSWILILLLRRAKRVLAVSLKLLGTEASCIFMCLRDQEVPHWASPSCPRIFLQNAFSVAFSSLSGRMHSSLWQVFQKKPLKRG